MSIQQVKVRNFKKHKDLVIDCKGQSFFLVGDSEEGKTTVIDLIKAVFMQGKFPANPLTDGEENGSVTVVTDGNGLTYNITRTFSKKKGVSDRYTITDQNGATHKSLETVLGNILGPAFANKFFDWQGYFYKTKSPQGRFEYLVEALGGPEIIANTISREEKIKERKTIGGLLDQQKKFYYENGGSDDKEVMERDYVYYQKDRKVEDVLKLKEAFLNANLIDPEEIQLEKDIVDSIIERKAFVTYDIPQQEQRIKDIDAEIKKLKAEQAAAKKTVKEHQKQLTTLDPEAETKSASYAQQLEQAEEHNKKVNEDAELAYIDNLNTMMQFNIKRSKFFDNMNSLTEVNRLSKEWDAMTENIKELKDKNSEIFKNNLPIPELSVDVDSQGKGIVLYNGKEFSLDNISTGQSIQITAQIQRILNPTGTSFIIIPDAQNLGSKIDSVVEECSKFGIQAIVEVTKRDQKFQVVITDDAKSI